MDLSLLQFQTEECFAETEKLPRQFLLGSVVGPATVLVKFSEEDDASGSDEKGEAGLYEIGEHITWTSDNELISECSGYPIITKSDAAKKGAAISILPLIFVTEGKTEARLNIIPLKGIDRQVDKNDVTVALAHQKIIFGVDQQAIENGFDQVKEEQLPLFDHLIARCRVPVHGQDAFLRFHIEIGPIPGKVLADGSMDFRERRLFIGVKKKQVIATKVPLTDGAPGCDIEGNDIPAHKGSDLNVEVSDDACFHEEDMTIRATASGILSVVNEKSIRVASMQRIEGDVDFSTGNIRSQNSVEVAGGVLPDFTVAVKGDLLVGGNVQSAQINSRGNLVVQGGVIGPNSHVKVRGDGDFNYIERGYVEAGGDVVIRSNSYYSYIEAAGNMFCDDKAKLVGGAVVVGGSIKVGQIGTTAAQPTSVAVGVHPKRYRRYRELKKQYDQLVDVIQSHYNRHGKKGGTRNVSMYLEELKEVEKELTTLNLIPEMAEDSLGNSSAFISSSEIVVEGLLAAGTSIHIGNDTMVVKRDITGQRIAMNSLTGAIQFIKL